MLGLCNIRAPLGLLVECKTKSTYTHNRCSDILFVSTTSQNLLKEVCVIGIQQMDLLLLKSSKIKHLEHLKTLQVGIWVTNV
jgi:hypothetical protein